MKNITKVRLFKVMVALLTLFILMTMTGCSYVIPFELIASNPKESKKTNNEVEKIQGININEISLSKEEIVFYKDVITSFTDTLKDKKNILNKIDSAEFYNFFAKYFSKNLILKLKSEIGNNPIKEMIKGFYSDDKMIIKSATLISIKYEEQFKLITFDINAENKDIGFHVQRLQFKFDKNNKVVEVTPINGISDVINTSTPLDKNSMLSNNKEFLASFELLKKRIKNENLFRDIEEGIVEGTELDSFLSEALNGYENITPIKSIFIASKGNLKNYSIVAIEYNNINAKAQSIYTIRIPQVEKTLYFNVYFNRINNKIEDIKIKEGI